MRWLLSLLLVGCTCAGGPPLDDSEARARAALGRRQVTEVELERVDERTFDFSGQREGHACTGTIVVNPASAAMQLECD